jgi:hypothetical protein
VREEINNTSFQRTALLSSKIIPLSPKKIPLVSYVGRHEEKKTNAPPLAPGLPLPPGPKSHFILSFLQCVHAPGLLVDSSRVEVMFGLWV